MIDASPIGVTSCNELVVNFPFLLHFNCLSFCFSFLESQFKVPWFTLAQKKKKFLECKLRNYCDDELSSQQLDTRVRINFKRPSGVEMSGRKSFQINRKRKLYQLQSNYMREIFQEGFFLCWMLNSAVRERRKFFLSSAHHEHHRIAVDFEICVSNSFAMQRDIFEGFVVLLKLILIYWKKKS